MEDVLVLEMDEEVVEEVVSKGWRLLSWLLLLWWLLLRTLLVLESKMVVVVTVVVVGGGGGRRVGGGGERGPPPPPQFPLVPKLPNPLTGMSEVVVMVVVGVSGSLPWRWWCWWWRLLAKGEKSPLGRRTPPLVPRYWWGWGCWGEALTRLGIQGGWSTPRGEGEDSVVVVESCVWAGIIWERMTGWGEGAGSVEERPGVECSRWFCC